jgi:ornithine cyclodeaminase
LRDETKSSISIRILGVTCHITIPANSTTWTGFEMKFISEEQSAALITHEIAYMAVREALIAAAGDQSTIFPAVLAHGSVQSDRFSIKSGATADIAGLKVGSYWPGNESLGLPRHNSAILLIDQKVGRVEWVIEAGKVNAYRTAAADAVACDVLARPDASTLAIFGAGHQALYECLAISRIRSIEQVLVVARDGAKAEAFADKLNEYGLHAEISDARDACAHADIVVAATPARAPLFENDWVRPGTHVASMGSDAAGKQELPPALFDRAELFCDFPAQSVVIGDLQHFPGDRSRIVAIGDVLAGRHPGRTSPDQITIFDSSGISLQDLYVARQIIESFKAL